MEWGTGKSDSAAPRLHIGSEWVDGDAICGVLYRPGYHDIDRSRAAPTVLAPDPEFDEGYREFARAEGEAAVLGALLSTQARWVNHPLADQAADLKLAQLSIAARLGLFVPRTLVAHDADELTAFWHEHNGEVICKSVSARPNLLLRETLLTRRVVAEDLDKLGDNGSAMVLFQQLVPAALDLRVTLIGEQTFAVAIHSQDGAAPLDWRVDPTVRMEPFTLDPVVVDRLQQLRRQLGLEYGAADLRLTPAGEPVFLELNAQGSYLFVERIVGLPLTAALAELLLTPQV